MDGLEPLVSMNDLKWDRLSAARGHRPLYSIRYNNELDTLILLLVEPAHPTIVYFVDDQVGLVYEDETLEIVGLHIEDFVGEFLPAHSSAKHTWYSKPQIQVNNYAEFSMSFKTTTQRVAREVVRATSDTLGVQAKKLEQALEAA